MPNAPDTTTAARLEASPTKKPSKHPTATVFDLWKIVNNLTRLRPTKRERYRVTIFGSARAQPGTFAYDEVNVPPPRSPRIGCNIVTGGGPGFLQAANEGATSASAP